MQSKIKELRSDELKAKVTTLQNNLKDDVRRLDELQQKKILEHAAAASSSSNPNIPWTNSYRKWDEWEDEEELENRIETTRERLTKLSSSRDSKRTSTGRSNGCAMPAQQLCCPSSQSRSAERAVAKMSIKERLKCMKAFRQEHGNRCFEKRDFVAAIKWYEKSLLYYEYCLPSSDQEREAVDQERLKCCLNSAACHLELKHYRQCIECCTEALEVANGKSVKALYRRAKAYRCSCEFDKALLDLEKAMVLGKNSTSFQSVLNEEYAVLQEVIQSYQNKTKMVAEKMMKKSY